MRLIANILSIAFHPLLMVTYGVALAFASTLSGCLSASDEVADPVGGLSDDSSRPGYFYFPAGQIWQCW